MALGAIRAGKAFVEVYADGTRLASDFKKIGNQFKAFGAGISAIGLKIMGVGTAITAPFAAAIKHFMDAGDQLDKMAARTGVSTNALSELGFAAEQSGASISEIEKSIRKMQRTIMDAASGEKTYVDALKAANVAYKDLQGQSPESQFEKIADGINNIADPTAKAAAAMEIFGRSGTMLLPMLGSVHALREEARELGLSIGPEQAKQAAVMTDAWNRLKRSTMAVFFNIGSAVADSGFLDAVTNSIKFVSRWVKANGDLLRTVAKVGAGLVAGGAAMFAFGKAIQFVGGIGVAIVGGISAAFAAAVAGVGFLSTAFALLTNPITIAAVAIAAAVVAFAGWENIAKVFKSAGNWLRDFFNSVSAGFSTIADDASKAWQGIKDSLVAGNLDLTWKIITTSIQLEWVRMVGALQKIVEPFREYWVDFSYGLASTFIEAMSWIKKELDDLEYKASKQFFRWQKGGESKEIINEDWLKALEKNPEAFKGIGSPESIRARMFSGIQPQGMYEITPEMQAELNKQRDKRLEAWKTFDEVAGSNVEEYKNNRQKEIAQQKENEKKKHLVDEEKYNAELQAALAARDAAIEESRQAAKNADKQRGSKTSKRVRRQALLDWDIDFDKTRTFGTFSGQELAGTGGRSPALLELKAHTALFKKFIVVGAETSLAIKNLKLELAK